MGGASSVCVREEAFSRLNSFTISKAQYINQTIHHRTITPKVVCGQPVPAQLPKSGCPCPLVPRSDADISVDSVQLCLHNLFLVGISLIPSAGAAL